tara:strand:+ start:92 stop:589 length:498 start_codon:yes stop_codon:yes gene_type:complete
MIEIYKVIKLHNIDNSVISKRVYEIQSSFHGLVVEGSSSFHTKYNYIKDKAFTSLLYEIVKILNGYYIEDVWFNIYKKGGYVKEHNHIPNDFSKHYEYHANPNKHLSAVYNVKRPFNSGNFYLNQSKINMNEGDFFAFTSNDMHYTTPSQSDEDRIVMSFNLIKE